MRLLRCEAVGSVIRLRAAFRAEIPYWADGNTMAPGFNGNRSPLRQRGDKKIKYKRFCCGLVENCLIKELASKYPCPRSDILQTSLCLVLD